MISLARYLEVFEAAEKLCGYQMWNSSQIQFMWRRSVCCQEKINESQKVAYFWAFCEVSIIRGALRKARFSYMETYPLSKFSEGRKMSGRVYAVD